MNPLVTLNDVVYALTQGPETKAVYLFGSTARQLRAHVSDYDYVLDYVSDYDRPSPLTLALTNKDYDLVVTVSAEIYEALNARLNSMLGCEADCELPDDAYHGCKWYRFGLALKLLGCGTYKESAVLYRWLATLDRIKELDLHLMPEDWMSRPGELQKDLPHKDETFVSNIAKDAVLVSEGIGEGNVYDWLEGLIKRLGDEYRSQSTTA